MKGATYRMTITPPPDNKQEQVSYSTDHVGPDLDEEALLRFKSRFALDEIKENFEKLEPFKSLGE